MIVFDAVTAPAVYNYGDPSPYAFNHAGGSGLNRVALVGVEWANKSGSGLGAVTGVTYGGVAMTSLGPAQTQATGSMQFFILLNPPTGTQSVSIAYTPASVNQPLLAICATYTGAYNYQNYGTAKATNSGPVTKTITGATGNLIVALGGLTESIAALTAFTVTDRANVAGTVNGDVLRLAFGEVASGASVAATWTIGGAAHWVVEAVDLIAAPSTSAVVTGTGGAGMTGAEVRAGAKTLIVTLTGDTFVAAGAAFDAVRQAIINGIVAATSPTWGWNNTRPSIPTSAVVRTSSTVCTITLPALAGYQSDTTETLTITVPASAVVLAAAIVATPTVAIARTVTDLSPVGNYELTGTASTI